MPTPRILSGIKPTGKPHIGNYFGMMRPAIEWQERGEAFYFIADYHALTTVRDPAALRENSRGVALDFLACGLDPAKAVLFRQSDVPQVTELAWILTCMTPMPMLENCHAYKDQLGKDKPILHGLFAYPVLMAADILLYDSNIVPVGRDQKQHVEVTRDIAAAMNREYGNILIVPEASILPELATIPGLDGRKMSKSYDNTVELFPEEKALRKKIMGITTDSTPVEAPKDPDASTIVGLIPAFCLGFRCPNRWRPTSARAGSATEISRSGSSAQSGNISHPCGRGARNWRPIRRPSIWFWSTARNGRHPLLIL